MNNATHNNEVIYKSVQAKDFIKSTADDRPDDCYDLLLSGIRQSFYASISKDEPLFTTNANDRSGNDLYDIFLENLPVEARQHYNCRTCRNFVNRYGGLVKVTDNGSIEPIMWHYYPAFFTDAAAALFQFVKKSKITGVFITEEKRLGIPKTGVWEHMSVDMPKDMIFKNRLLTSDQAAAEKLEDFKMLMSATKKYSIDTVKTAVNLLRSDSMYRSEKVLGIAEWFLEVMDIAKQTNLIWKKVATAPNGFCHVSSSMIGTLLDDIEAGYDFETIKRKFNEKMNPMKYQRPQAAPSAGNVARAEKIISELGLERSLKRRYARLDEVETLWTPSTVTSVKESTGIFSNVKTKVASKTKTNDILPSAVTMTWSKFERTVLPIAKKMELYIDYDKNSYGAVVTAEDYDAPPIIRWDTEDKRNPFSWYLKYAGSRPSEWNLVAGKSVEVTGIVYQPNMWQDGHEDIGAGVIIVLKNCRDLGKQASSALFPEILRSELREVRSTIEAYSKQDTINGVNEASVCGLILQSGIDDYTCKIKVTTDVGVSVYKIDRWD